jgi:adenylosuccinate synthase
MTMKIKTYLAAASLKWATSLRRAHEERALAAQRRATRINATIPDRIEKLRAALTADFAAKRKQLEQVRDAAAAMVLHATLAFEESEDELVDFNTDTPYLINEVIDKAQR